MPSDLHCIHIMCGLEEDQNDNASALCNGLCSESVACAVKHCLSNVLCCKLMCVVSVKLNCRDMGYC